MEVEHQVKVFPLDAELEKNIREMSDQGWLMEPGVVPVAIYHVVRMKGVQLPVSTQEAAVSFGIDETKVQIIRNGQPVK